MASHVHDVIGSGVTDLKFELEPVLRSKVERAEARLRARLVIPEEVTSS